MLNVPLTQLELEAAVAGFANNKAPGVDDIPFEVYKKYSDVLFPGLLKMFNLVLVEGLSWTHCPKPRSWLSSKKIKIHYIQSHTSLSLYYQHM